MLETAGQSYRFVLATSALLGAIAVSAAAQTPGSNETEAVGGNRTATVGSDRSAAASSKPKEIVVVGSKVKEVVRSQNVTLLLQGTVPVEVRDPGRTGLEPGRYALVPPNRPARLGDNIRIRLKSWDHRLDPAADATELLTSFEGCDASEPPGKLHGQVYFVMLNQYDDARVIPRADGSLELRVPSREDPACALVGLLLPAIQKVRR